MIHGTKKSKKVPTEQQRAADQALSIKIRDSLNEFISLRHHQKTDIPYLTQFTQILIELCSDISTIYNFRREVIDLQLSKFQTNEEKAKLLEVNLKMVTKLMKSDPKSYNIWNFRKWLVIKLFELSNSNEIIGKELELCKMMLMKDEKNFHVWNYRNWLNQLHIEIDQALDFTLQKIKSNPFNFSPLHFRTKHLSQKYQDLILREDNEEVLQYGMPLSQFNEELERIKEPLFINPNEEAPWMYYKWLVNLAMPCAVISIAKVSDVCYQVVTNSLIENLKQENMSIKTDTQILGGFEVQPKDNKLPSNEWVLTFEKAPATEPTIEILSNFQYKLSFVKPEYGWFFLGTSKPEDKLRASRTIIQAQIKFIRQILQSQNHKCRYASQCLLDLYKLQLFFCTQRSEWTQILKDVSTILQNLSTETKGKKYIEKITEHWKSLEEGITWKLSRQEIILLNRLSN